MHLPNKPNGHWAQAAKPLSQHRGWLLILNETAIAKTALIKAEAVLATWPASNEIDETSPPKGAQ
jgi:hypothetical protein